MAVLGHIALKKLLRWQRAYLCLHLLVQGCPQTQGKQMIFADYTYNGVATSHTLMQQPMEPLSERVPVTSHSSKSPDLRPVTTVAAEMKMADCIQGQHTHESLVVRCR